MLFAFVLFRPLAIRFPARVFLQSGMLCMRVDVPCLNSLHTYLFLPRMLLLVSLHFFLVFFLLFKKLHIYTRGIYASVRSVFGGCLHQTELFRYFLVSSCFMRIFSRLADVLLHFLSMFCFKTFSFAESEYL